MSGLARRARAAVSIACVVGCLSIAASAAAQETVNFASVSGRVTDASGATIPGASVTARQVDTNITADTVTDTSGRFRFPYLRVGAYEIRITLAGFQTVTRQLTLTLGSAFEYTLSKSMNNVGENFFSSPIDPFDIWKDWGRSDGDQRHRLAINGGATWRDSS